MSDPSTNRSEQALDASPTTPGATGQPASRLPLSGNLALVALVLAALAAAAVGVFWQRTDSVSREAARRLQQGDARTAQLESQLKQAQEITRELQARSAVLESKLTDVLGQQAQLERMYQNIAQDSIATVLGEVENAVSIASQQLAVSGNVRGAVVALQDADARLKRINQPEAVGIRRLIARDLDRLRAVPNVDVIALALRLDAVAAGINQLPLVASLNPVAGGPATAGQTDAVADGFSIARLAHTGKQGWRALVEELSQLFRVNRIDAPDAMLLAPDQQYFVRENLRLSLLSARLALLARAEPVFRSDLERSIDWIDTYYDRQNRAVENAVATLRQLESSRFAAELPSLGDTLSAVRTARASREGNP